VILAPIYTVNTTLSTGCPTVVTITPSTGTFEAGDELTCSADGYIPIYTWTGTDGLNGATVSESGAVYTLPEGPFYVICTATVSQLSCRDSATVDDTAYSKYQNKTTLWNNVDEKPGILSDVCEATMAKRIKIDPHCQQGNCCTLKIIHRYPTMA